MISHIKTLKELKKLTCIECTMPKEIACCNDPIQPRVCCYIESLNYAIEMLEAIQTLTETNKRESNEK